MKDKKIFIIAEIGNLHEGSVGLAKRFIKEVANCRADAVKFQTHIFDAESLECAPAPDYFKTESRKKYLERTAFSLGQWKELKDYAQKECGIEFISSPFSIEALNLLEEVGVVRYKVPSGEVSNIPLLERIAETRKPVLLSSGMSGWSELDNAVGVLKSGGCPDITILQCTSMYPCPPDKVGLNILCQLKERYDLRVGFSDHTLGVWASIAAVVLGAQVIEKHFTLSRKMYGSDAKHSLEPDEFKIFIREIREAAESVSAQSNKDDLAKDLEEMKIIFEKSIVAAQVIPKGTIITMDMINFKKPGDGIGAARYKEVLGRVAKTDIETNTKIREEMLG
jgi:sialic acid synthase SpsE